MTGVLYTRSHVDHFGGVRGVARQQGIDGGVPVIAPEGFLEHAVGENVYAGTAMGRRAAYMYGADLPTGERGQIGAGLGQSTSTGTVGLIPPTLDVTHSELSETVDGTGDGLPLTPGTEAPAELGMHFPDHSALYMADNATHNLLTPRGAQVRNPPCAGPLPHRGRPGATGSGTRLAHPWLLRFVRRARPGAACPAVSRPLVQWCQGRSWCRGMLANTHRLPASASFCSGNGPRP